MSTMENKTDFIILKVTIYWIYLWGGGGKNQTEPKKDNPIQVNNLMIL